MRIPAFFLGSAVTAAVFSISAAQTAPTGALRADTRTEFGPQATSGRTFNEIWTYQFLLNNDIQVQASLSKALFGTFKEAVCGADLAVMNFKGKNAFVAREYPAARFQYDPGSARLQVHPSIYAQGLPPREHRLVFSTEKDGKSYFLDLTFENMAQGAVWGDGVFRLAGGHRMGLYFHIPGARVRGRLALDGDTIAVQGFGSMDHTWQTHFAPRLIDAGYRYSAVSGPAESGLFLKHGKDVFGYGVRVENGQAVLLTPRAIEASGHSNWGGTSLPKKIEVTLDGRPAMALQRAVDRQRVPFLQELSAVERLGARMFLGGELIGFHGTATLDDGRPAIYSFTSVKK